MKKIILIILGFMFIFIGVNQVYAYDDFEWYEKVGNFKLLNEFSDKDYKDNYKKVKKKFDGWSIHMVNENKKINFISETIFTYYNDGFSPLKYQHKTEREFSEDVSLKVSGGVSLKTKKDTKIFGDGLNAQIESKFSFDTKKTEKESYTINVDVMPGTKLVLSYAGEGRVTNGVAKKYLFFFEINKGGYEVFRITSQFRKMEITQIWKKY